MTHSRRVMIVDDDPLMLRTARRVLEQDYTLESTARPEEALDLALRFGPDLVLLDVQMPGISGFDVLERLKSRLPHVDVIFVTGSTERGDLHAELVETIRAKAFFFIQKPFDRQVLQTIVARCFELRDLRIEERRHTASLERNLAEARAFQQGLLPVVPARPGGFDVHARYRPHASLGGDFFDFAEIGPGAATVLMADVSGHGVPAAMISGMVKAAFHSAHADAYEPAAVLGRIASGLRGLGTSRYVTAVCARVFGDPPQVEYVSAGHPPALLISKEGRLVELESTGFWASGDPAMHGWEQVRVPFAAGDHLLLYTDGLTDARCGDEIFGGARLREALLCAREPSHAALDLLLAQVDSHCGPAGPDDDITMLSLAHDR